MMFYSLFVVLLICCNAFGNAVNRRVIRQSGSNSCTTPTPDNKPGTCIRLVSCPYLQKVLTTSQAQEPETKKFLRDSQCGKDTDNSPKVCCNLNPNNPSVIPSITRLGPVNPPPVNPPPVVNTNTSQTDPSRDYSVCGKSNFDRIVGGLKANIGDWPWLVAIGYRRASNPEVTWECGGSLIADRWIVTAAHCTQGIGSLILTRARIGDLNLDNSVADGASPVERNVDRIIAHPAYQSSPVANDIALLHLSEPVTFTSQIRPICIPKGEEYKSDGFYSNKSPFIAGWGHTQGSMQSAQTRSNALLMAQVDIVDVEVCDQNYKSGGARALIDARTLCAMRKGIDSCQGDSGGPLMFPIRGKFNLAGVVSYGIGCANEKFPGVYTRVAYFADWIRSTTGLAL